MNKTEGPPQQTDRTSTLPPIITPNPSLPPYVPFKTFMTFIDSLKVGVPSHIDRSVMGSMSGGMQSWVMASLRSMSLIDGAGVPTRELRILVAAEGDDRKHALAALFHQLYGFLLKAGIDLKTTTPSKVQAAFGELGAKGETVEKCIAFMKAMAKEGGIELSPYLTKRSARQRLTPRTNRSKAQGEGDESDMEENDTAGESTAMKTITLPKAGGSLTLSGNFNPFMLVGDERDLVYALIDKMNDYESKQKGENE